MYPCQSRRDLLKAAAGAYLAAPALLRGAASPPATTVAVAKCPDYGPELLPTLDRMFDQLGGLGRIVKGKTVAAKINLTGSPTYRLGHLPCEDTHYTHPKVIGAVCYLMSRAGARRIRLLESPWATADSVEEYLLQANWEPREILNSAPNVEFENTNFLGESKKYARLAVPHGGLMFPAFDLNHSYNDCDVFVSLAKMKEHATAGVTLSMPGRSASDAAISAAALSAKLSRKRPLRSLYCAMLRSTFSSSFAPMRGSSRSFCSLQMRSRSSIV